MPIFNGDYNAVMIAFDIKNHAIVSDKTGTTIAILDVSGCFPLALIDIF